MSSRILVPLLIGIFCLVAAIAGANLAIDSGTTMVYLALFFGAVFLLAQARNYWWVALLVGAAFGGYAYFGVKIYAHELMLAAALGGLIPSVAMNPSSPLAAERPKLPWYFYAFGIYLGIHIVLSIWWHEPRGFVAYGNVVRAYVNGLWPLVFVFFFRAYGRSDLFPFAVHLLQATYILRALIVVSFHVFPKAMILPGVNFLLPGTATGAGFDDLRWSGYGICLTSSALILAARSNIQRVLQFALLGASFVALVAGGGRAMLVSGLLAAAFALLCGRYWKILGAVGSLVFCGLLYLNLFPESLHALDRRWERTLSILVIGYKNTANYAMVAGSDEWHDRLATIGYERWTESPRTVVLGYGIRPWEQNVMRESNWTMLFEALMQGAADTGNYESALWTTLAVTGLVGFLLCVATLFHFQIFNLRTLIKERPTGFALCAAFLGTFPPLHWLLFSPRLGSYPSLDLMFAAVAYFYLWDQRTGKAPVATPVTDDESSSYADDHA